jgi:exonuclease III
MLTLVSWNCSWEKGGFNKEKCDYITEKYNPNILIIQECKYSECVQANSFPNFTWYGDGKDSKLGIGIFSKEHKFELINEFKYNTPFRYVIPYSLKLHNEEIILFAVWTKNYIYKDNFNKFDYLNNLHEAIAFYKDILKKNVIIIGDFNTADKPDDRKPRHIELINKLKEYNINNRMPKDMETYPTFYMNFEPENPFTNDYCFASEGVKVTKVDIGESCLKYSDHCPLIVTLDY